MYERFKICNVDGLIIKLNATVVL